MADLLAGIGGGGLGASRASFKNFRCKVVASQEICPLACKTLQLVFPNSNVIEGDFMSSEVQQQLNTTQQGEPFDVITMGLQCQGVSKLNAKVPSSNKDNNHPRFADARNEQGVRMFGKVIMQRPRFIIVEEVRNWTTASGGQFYKAVVKAAENARYRVTTVFLDSAKFGLPVTRERVYLVMQRDGGLQVKAYVKALERKAHARKRTTVVEWHPQAPAWIWQAASPDRYPNTPQIVPRHECLITVTTPTLDRRLPKWKEYQRREQDPLLSENTYNSWVWDMDKSALLQLQGFPGNYPIASLGSHCKQDPVCRRSITTAASRQLGNVMTPIVIQCLMEAILVVAAVNSGREVAITPEQFAEKVYMGDQTRYVSQSIIADHRTHRMKAQHAGSREWTREAHYDGEECDRTCRC